ncbi:MAG TPA: hypothetical protein PKV50_05890 [Prolixibacteraceae bacterium]|nr:hypothetical protein [Prolixibacteraceae bacterium]
MKMLCYALIVALSIVITACERVIEVDFDELNLKQKIAIQGYLSKDNTRAYIFKSLPLDNIKASNYLESPKVWLYKNNIPYAPFYETDSCKYKLNDSIILNDNADYNIVVEDNELGKAVSNTQQLLQKVTIDTMYFTYDTIQWRGLLYVEFFDYNPNYNWHSISIKGYRKNDPSFEMSTGGSIDDSGYRTNKRVYCDYFLSRFDSAIVTVTTISDVLIDFIISHDDYCVTSGSYDYETIFPVKNYITNGYGFFGAQEKSTYIYNK